MVDANAVNAANIRCQGVFWHIMFSTIDCAKIIFFFEIFQLFLIKIFFASMISDFFAYLCKFKKY